MSLDHHFLNIAHNLAVQNLGNTSPNPSVGAVVVKDNQVLAYAFHHRPGESHAEVLAIQRAGDAARGATLYSTLEPCCHQGKTPPCSDFISEHGIARVVFGAVDRNPWVSGKGRTALESKGIAVDQIRNSAIDALYEPFFSTFAKGRPYVISKAALTMNGIISPSDRNSRWITNETSLAYVHQMRAQCDAILVGADTVLLDRPHLTVRAEGVARRPLRVIIDARFKLQPEDSSLLESDVPVLICGLEIAPAGKEDAWKGYNVETHRFRNLRTLLGSLFQQGVLKMIIEGGQKIYTFFHTAGLIDEYILMIAPRLLTGKNFLNFLGGPEQSLTDSGRYKIDPPLDLDGDILLRLRK
jgi:diaminohydroxyphosphoribosylaminopyrimidine deaminase / 5-amino-6-(5-phosphoribosylamino)uracil reductase